MSIYVYPWPPVGAVGSEWTPDQPLARLRSALTGRDVLQASRPPRRLATVVVSSLAAGRAGAGYCEMLKQLLAGGIHAVRLRSFPINWWLDELDREAPALNSQLLDWIMPTPPLSWGGVRWVTGSAVVAGVPSSSGPWGLLPVSGLPPHRRVAAPGDFIVIYDPANPSTLERARVMRIAVTNGAGQVTLKLDRVPTIANGRVNLAGQDEAVFRVEGALPRSVQPVSGDWTYTWNFREVFADEVGGFAERPSVWT